jgi:GTP-binding protein
LKLLADVGLVGLPNVGKSTLIRAVSHARPKVADYPFTTLEPHLGVVHLGDSSTGLGRTFVLADIPGLVPKASQGAGLGFRFLRHLERTRVLLHLVTATDEPGRTPLGDYRTLRDELRSYSPELWARSEVVAMTKSDLPEAQAIYQQAREDFAGDGIQLRLVSAVTRQGIMDLMQELGEKLGI